MNYKEVRQRNFALLCDYVNDKNVLQDYLENYFDEDDFDDTTDFNDISNSLEDKSAFNCEVIYYSNAIEYLSKNDPSLHESLEIAEEFGYSPKDLSSEILASLLKSENTRRDWYDEESDVQDFLNNLDWDYSDEEEEEEETANE